MNKSKVFLLFLGALLAIAPFAVIMGWGFYELYFSNFKLLWFGCSSLSLLAAWLLWARITEAPKIDSIESQTPSLLLEAEPFWNSKDTEVWQQITQIARAYEYGARVAQEPQELIELFRELVGIIAQHYKGKVARPELEITVSDLLVVLENSCTELRTEVIENIPLHHMITIGDMARVQHISGYANQAFTLYRAVRTLTNPIGAILAETQNVLSKKAMKDIAKYGQNWLLARAIEGLGKHLINLYSGNAIKIDALPSAAAGNDGTPAFALNEPLRILVIGQTSAGKSSLINALFGELTSPTAPVPCTETTMCFEKELDELGKIQIFDTQGYGQSGTNEVALQEMLTLAPQSDCIIMMTAANEASRKFDAELIEKLRALKLDPAPPICLVINKIDKLRPFKEWDPPYNLSEEHTSAKASNIRDSIAACAEDLSIPAETVVPVMLADPENPYNIDMLILCLTELLPQAKSLLLRRAIRKHRSTQNWEKLKGSFLKSGRIVAKYGLDYVTKSMRQVIDSTRRE